MNESEFIGHFIKSPLIEPDRYSCLVVALKDARRITGRDVDTGVHKLNIPIAGKVALNPYSFIGCVNYLLILDMIGVVFKKPTFATPKVNGIYRALKQFSRLVDRDIETVMAFRNCLAHNYGLVNIPTHTKDNATKRHKFTLINDNTSRLIEYPLIGEEWDGNFLDKFERSSTKIGYENLCDLVEEVYREIKDLYGRGLLSLALVNGVDELKARFTVRN